MKTAVNQATLMKSSMENFLKSIAQAGFDGVELRRDETFAYLEDHSIADLKHLLDENHLKVVSWNAIELFSLCHEDEFQSMLDYSERLMQIGQEIGCNLIIAVPSFKDQSVFPESQLFDKTVERFQILRKLAKNYNFNMGFEPLGFPNCSVRKIEDALKILDAAEEDGLPPSGLIIDTFHYFLGEHSSSDLSQIPLDRLWLVHFNDCVNKPIDILQDCDRVWPGEGFFDLQGFITQLRIMKYEGYVSLELFNPEYWKQDPTVASQTAYKTLKQFL